MKRRTRRLTMQDRFGISILYHSGFFTQSRLGELFGVSTPRISQIVNDPDFMPRGEEE